MVEVLFFEKPGCINNTRQKKLLAEAGHTVIARNLLEHAWQKQQLRAFFGDLPVSDWFNMTAPAIKEGTVQPGQLNEEQALELMMQDPLLIRRPLMQIAGEARVGFDVNQVDAWIGLGTQQADNDLETCPRQE